jgi:hypothetical protein
METPRPRRLLPLDHQWRRKETRITLLRYAAPAKTMALQRSTWRERYGRMTLAIPALH